MRDAVSNSGARSFCIWSGFASVPEFLLPDMMSLNVFSLSVTAVI